MNGILSVIGFILVVFVGTLITIPLVLIFMRILRKCKTVAMVNLFNKFWDWYFEICHFADTGKRKKDVS